MPDNVEKLTSPAERPPMPEVGKELSHEAAPQVERASQEEITSEVVPGAPAVLAVPEPTASVDPIVRNIEKILSEDMLEHFKAMSPSDQAKFRAKGEETVSKLVVLMRKTAIKAKEVLMLIIGWLCFIPHVNKYFLEQESKIKTDKLLELHKREHGGE